MHSLRECAICRLRAARYAFAALMRDMLPDGSAICLALLGTNHGNSHAEQSEAYRAVKAYRVP